MAVIEKSKGSSSFRFNRFLFAFAVLLMALGGWIGIAYFISSFFEPDVIEIFKSLPQKDIYALFLVQAGYFFVGIFILYLMVRRGKLTPLEVLMAFLVNLALTGLFIFKVL